MNIIHLVASDDALLMVYTTSDSLYSYQILFGDGDVYQPQEPFPHAYIALNLGREQIKLVTGYSE